MFRPDYQRYSTSRLPHAIQTAFQAAFKIRTQTDLDKVMADKSDLEGVVWKDEDWIFHWGDIEFCPKCGKMYGVSALVLDSSILKPEDWVEIYVPDSEIDREDERCPECPPEDNDNDNPCRTCHGSRDCENCHA